MHAEGRRALRSCAIPGLLGAAVAVALVLYGFGVNEWWQLAIILIGLVVFGLIEVVHVYRSTRIGVARMKARGERRMSFDELLALGDHDDRLDR